MCSLWSNYTKNACNTLRVQYNTTRSGFRIDGARSGLMELPWPCSASGMFADHSNRFQAVLRKRAASLWSPVNSSTNKLMSAVSDRVDSQILKHWSLMHVQIKIIFNFTNHSYKFLSTNIIWTCTHFSVIGLK